MRNWEAHGIIGGNAQGKSSLIVDLLTAYDMRSQKVVILNNTNPPAFQRFKFIDSPERLKGKWHGVVRYHNPDGFKQSMNDIYQLASDGYLSNGAVVFDDCTKYIEPWPPEVIRNFLVDRRMFSLDLFFTTHALRFLPKFVRGMVNTITVFKTAEVFEKPSELKTLEYSNYHTIYQEWTRVMATPHNPKKYIQEHSTVETGI